MHQYRSYIYILQCRWTIQAETSFEKLYTICLKLYTNIVATFYYSQCQLVTLFKLLFDIFNSPKQCTLQTTDLISMIPALNKCTARKKKKPVLQFPSFKVQK